ncbi:hypothetical protein Tco_0088370 [Tanacetum coccineum]
MCTYLKNMAGFTYSQLKNKRFDEVQKAFDKTMGWIDSFVSMDSEVVKGGKEKDEGSVTRAEESSSKRAGTKLEHERIKKQKIDDDQEEAEMKKHMEIVVREQYIISKAVLGKKLEGSHKRMHVLSVFELFNSYGEIVLSSFFLPYQNPNEPQRRVDERASGSNVRTLMLQLHDL